MKTIATAAVKVAVKPSIGIGPTTVAGGGVTLVAFAVAVVAFAQGARDEQTLSALGVGVIGLVTVLGGRYAQAVAAVFALRHPTPPPAIAATPVYGTGTRVEITEAPRPGVDIQPVSVKPDPGDPPPLNTPGRKPTG